MKITPELKARLDNVEFMVDSTSSERFFLWEAWAKESLHRSVSHVALDWKEDSAGYSLQIATLDNRPVMLTFWFANLNGHRIAFYESNSQVVDWKAIEDFLIKNWKKWDVTTHYSTESFHNCVSEILHNNT